MKALLWDKLDHNENEISQKGKGREKMQMQLTRYSIKERSRHEFSSKITKSKEYIKILLYAELYRKLS